MSASPVLPDWNDGCVTQIVPGLLEPGPEPSPLFDDDILDAPSIVLLVIDGLGWHQLQARAHVAPALTGLAGRSITTVAPSTTSAALTSITTGLHPGEHGVVGYRIAVDDEVMNVLSWRTKRGDARDHIVPEDFQPTAAFCGQRPVVVQNAPFATTGFTRAHQGGGRQQGWRTLPTLPVEIRRAVAAGEPFVYAYYDGIDKIAHEFGFGEHYDAELAAVDRMVADLLPMLPRGTALVVTADHGLMSCPDGELDLAPEAMALCRQVSGEGRFRWLHAEPGHHRDVLDAAADAHGEHAWVLTQDQILDDGWFGPTVSDRARRRLGDVAVVARDHWSFADPADRTPSWLVARHGSLSPEEMHVPLLTFAS
ncbi:MAG: alkaline phosphatase family protein [Actinomycetota bacterium]